MRKSDPEDTVRQTEAKASGWVRTGLLATQRKGGDGLQTLPPHPPTPAERINQTVEILKHTVDIEEKGVKLKLTIVDTPGFGDAVNNSEW